MSEETFLEVSAAIQLAIDVADKITGLDPDEEKEFKLMIADFHVLHEILMASERNGESASRQRKRHYMAMRLLDMLEQPLNHLKTTKSDVPNAFKVIDFVTKAVEVILPIGGPITLPMVKRAVRRLQKNHGLPMKFGTKVIKELSGVVRLGPMPKDDRKITTMKDLRTIIARESKLTDAKTTLTGDDLKLRANPYRYVLLHKRPDDRKTTATWSKRKNRACDEYGKWHGKTSEHARSLTGKCETKLSQIMEAKAPAGLPGYRGLIRKLYGEARLGNVKRMENKTFKDWSKTLPLRMRKIGKYKKRAPRKVPDPIDPDATESD